MRTTPLLALGLLAACGDGAFTGTKIGNPPLNPEARVRMELTAWSSDESVVALPAAGGLTSGATITRAILGVEEIRLIEALPDGSCPISDDGPEIERSFTADLLERTPLREIEVSKETLFCQIRVDLEEGEDLGGSKHGAILGDAEILVEGSRADGTPFVLRSDNIGRIRIGDGRTPFSFDEDEVTWLLAFDVARWFASVDLDGAAVSNGSIRIDDDNNRGLLEQFEAVVESGANACDDDDGEVDDDCRSPILGEDAGGDDGSSAED